MRILLKDLEKAIAYIRKNSGDEVITLHGGISTIQLIVADLTSRNVTITIHDDDTKKVPDITRTDKL